MENISNKIKSELQRQAKKQKELADFLNIKESSLSRMLTEQTFKRDIMVRIAEFLNVDISFFNRDSNIKSHGATQEKGASGTEDVQLLKQIIETKDEVIRAKDEIIATLREKLDK